MAEAGPLAASSEGVEPGMVGKPGGRLSQMRPQSVSDWLVADPALLAAAGIVGVAAIAGGEERLGDAGDLAEEQAASAIASVATSPMRRQFTQASYPG